MAYTDKLIEEFAKDDETVETVVETQKEEPQPEKTEPVEKVPEPEKVEDAPDQSEPEQPKADEPKKEYTKEERAEHAFKRQLSKQKERHQAEIEELKKSFQSQFDEFKKSMQPAEPVKSRSDFENDDQYIAYLAKNAVNGVMADRDAKAAAEAEEADKQRKEKEAREAENEALSRTFGENSHRAFKDEASYSEYSKKVNRALDNGLGEILDTVPTLRDYIFKNPEGPVVLNRMLTSRDDFTKVMMQTDPTMMIIAAHELANKPVETVQTPVEAPVVPHIGKPGARNASSEAGSMFGSDKSLMAYVRNCNSRRR